MMPATRSKPMPVSTCLAGRGETHKYDQAGNVQFYIARLDGKKWTSKQITNWDYRWEFSGGGSINFEVRMKDFNKRNDGYYEVDYYHIKYGNGTILLDKNFNNVGKVLKPAPFNESIKIEGSFPGLLVQMAGD